MKTIYEHRTDQVRIQSCDISCTIRVDVPVLTSVPTEWDQDYEEVDDDPYDELVSWLHENGFTPDDEIGLLARALPVSCMFRLQEDDKRWYRRADLEIAAMYNALDGSRVLGVDVNGRSKIVAGDTPVVVRVRDILPDYVLSEDK